MESAILQRLGIDPAFIFLFMLILIIALFVLYVNVSMKYDRLKNSYNSFMKGKGWKDFRGKSSLKILRDRRTCEADQTEQTGCQRYLPQNGERLQKGRYRQV